MPEGGNKRRQPAGRGTAMQAAPVKSRELSPSDTKEPVALWLAQPQAEPGGAVQFEPLLTVRATRRWLLGTHPCSAGGPLPSGSRQLHVLLATDGGDSSSRSSSNSGANSCNMSVVGVGQLALPLLGALPLGALPIQHEALQDCQLSCPSTGAHVGCISLAARLSAAPAAASSPAAQVPPKVPADTRGWTSSGSVDAVVTLQCTGSAAAAAGGRRTPSKRHAAAQASPAKPATAAAAGLLQPVMYCGSLPLTPCYLPMPMAPMYFPAQMQPFSGHSYYPVQQPAVPQPPWPLNSSGNGMAAAPAIATSAPDNPCWPPAAPQSQPPPQPPQQQPCAIVGGDCCYQAPPVDTYITSGSRRPETPTCPRPVSDHTCSIYCKPPPLPACHLEQLQSCLLCLEMPCPSCKRCRATRGAAAAARRGA